MSNDDPTAFYSWWQEGGTSDLALSEQTLEIDPRGRGISERTVRRIRYGLSADARSIKLLMIATGGLPFEAFLPADWLRRVG